MTRKGVLLSKKEARNCYIGLVVSPLLIALFTVTALDKAAERSLQEYVCWALSGFFFITLMAMSAALYGYHNRHRIDASNEQPHDFSGVHRAAIIGVAGVPLLREIYRWLMGN